MKYFKIEGTDVLKTAVYFIRSNFTAVEAEEVN
jgi:hypothetical protein